MTIYSYSVHHWSVPTYVIFLIYFIFLFILSPSIPLGWYLHMGWISSGEWWHHSSRDLSGCLSINSELAEKQSLHDGSRVKHDACVPIIHHYISLDSFTTEQVHSSQKTVTLISEKLFSRQRTTSLFRSAIKFIFTLGLCREKVTTVGTKRLCMAL